MRTIERSHQFKRDIKRMAKRGKSLDKLKPVICLLSQEKVLPLAYRDHALVGSYRGSRECHLEPDWLLIYTASHAVLRLERTGTHADLFR